MHVAGLYLTKLQCLHFNAYISSPIAPMLAMQDFRRRAYHTCEGCKYGFTLSSCSSCAFQSSESKSSPHLSYGYSTKRTTSVEKTTTDTISLTRLTIWALGCTWLLKQAALAQACSSLRLAVRYISGLAVWYHSG